MTRLRPLIALALALGIATAALPAAAQDPTPQTPDGPPFSLPFTDPAGPNTWLYEQHYGNTTAAFNYGDTWYSSGQGLHFGVDLEAPCGTPIHAIADGIVTYVDGSGFGAGPHNLVLEHPGTGYASLYGHLLQVPQLVRGQAVRRGDVIGLSGDPDGSCESRPHLHLEIRSADYQTAYNPLPFFQANWHMLASIGPFNNAFQQDLDAPYRWLTLENQPSVSFGGGILNNYARPWPPRLEVRAPANPPIARTLDPLPETVNVTLAPVSLNQWNLGAWWKPTDSAAVYLIDAVPGQAASVFRQPLDGSPRTFVETAPPALLSPAGDVTARDVGGGNMAIHQISTGLTWDVYTGGNFPAVSPDGTRLLWEVVYGQITPGQTDPGVEMWVSNLDGSLPRRVHTQSGGWSMWLDAHRLLIVKRFTYTADTQLFILDIDAPQMAPALLGQYRYLRGLSVAPGGAWIAFWLPFQANAGDSGVYAQRTEIGSVPQKLGFFGAYRWRDDRSLYTLSFDASQDAHALGYVDVDKRAHRLLTDPAALPIRVANGEWSVSPDGTRIVFVDPLDYGLYVLTVG